MFCCGPIKSIHRGFHGWRKRACGARKNLTVRRLAALANKTRLDCVLLLVGAEPEGMLATAVAQRLKVPKNTMSAHFNVLKAAGLISARREGRLVHYNAKREALMATMTLLTGQFLPDQLKALWRSS